MKRFWEKSKQNKSMILGVIFTFTLLCYYSLRLSVPVISDETITMGNAVGLLGKDWSLMVDATGGYYYKYLQALLTLPIFAVCDDPAAIYKMSMILNSIIYVSVIPVIYIICRRYLNMHSKVLATLLGVCVCLIPSSALYVFYYRGDILLSVLPWFALLAFLEAGKAADKSKKKKQILNTAVAAVLCALCYMAHVRGSVLLIALILSALFVRIVFKRKSLNWPVFLLVLVAMLLLDSRISDFFKELLYSISGLRRNVISSENVGSYFNIFSWNAIKSMVMLCVGWLYTLIITTQGLVLAGTLVVLCVAYRVFLLKDKSISDSEKIIVLFLGLIFAGYFAIGILHFKMDYYVIATGEMKRRVDSLIYDRYSICGSGAIVFLALYAISQRREWFGMKEKILCMLGTAGIFGLFFWKIYPLVLKYTGYIYNTISLNTFQTDINPAGILSGEYYEKRALIGATILGVFLMLVVYVLSCWKQKKVMYMLLALILVSDLAFIQINFVKIRKVSNDYVENATENVVALMQEFEDEITQEYPYVLKGGMSGIKIQFYQAQLMDYKLFGKSQEEFLNESNYFIISSHDDINLDFYDNDYYLFECFDYEKAEHDIVYVKGTELMKAMEKLGYEMIKYEVSESELQERE